MVYVFLAEGFEEIEAISIIDILRRADVTVKTISIHDTISVKGAHGVSVEADAKLDAVDLSLSDMLVLPGGMPGTKYLGESAALLGLLKEAYEKGQYVTAICAAPTVLAKAGLLTGKKAICYPGFESELSGAIVTDAEVVQDGKIITSKGPGTAMSFGYALAGILKGQVESDALKKAMIFN